jgi:hypothetical protein
MSDDGQISIDAHGQFAGGGGAGAAGDGGDAGMIRRLMEEVARLRTRVARLEEVRRLAIPSASSSTDDVAMILDLDQTGGSDGDESTSATWTYDIKADDGTTLASGVSPDRPRPNGSMTAADQGVCYQIGSTWYIADAYETPATTDDCSS